MSSCLNKDMDFKQWLSEMPMQNFQRLGNWEPDKKPTDAYQSGKTASKGYHKDDFGILSSNNAVEKIKQKWSKCEEPFSVFVLRSKEGARIREEGLVDAAFLADRLKLSPEAIQQIDNPSTINIVFTNNMGAERMPMNWWTMAHRVGHSMNRGGSQKPHVPSYDYFVKSLTKELYTMLDEVYNYKRKSDWEGTGYRGGGYEKPQKSGGQVNEQMLLSLVQEIGSMKSAREHKLRNLTEFFHELMAQYIIEGKVHFRPFPNMLPLSYAWGQPQGKYRNHDLDMEMWNDYLTDHVAPECNGNISHALHTCIGKIFVM